jgi:hypothetical protein
VVETAEAWGRTALEKAGQDRALAVEKGSGSVMANVSTSMQEYLNGVAHSQNVLT